MGSVNNDNTNSHFYLVLNLQRTAQSLPLHRLIMGSNSKSTNNGADKKDPSRAFTAVVRGKEDIV